jgi:predicted heme/steroid binding protein
MPLQRIFTLQVKMLFFALACSLYVQGQHGVYALKQELPDSLVFRTFCKQYFLFGQAQTSVTNIDHPASLPKTPLLAIHGNIRYDFLYRSYIDTPYAQRDFRQHTIQTNLQVTVRDKYPMRVNLVARTSNSPFFRNFLDANLQFDRYAYQQKYRERLLNRIRDFELNKPDLKMLEGELDKQRQRVDSLRKLLADPGLQQRLVREREQQYNKNLRLQQQKATLPFLKDSLSLTNSPDMAASRDSMKGGVAAAKDSLGQYADWIDSKRQELDSLQQKLGRLQVKYDSTRLAINNKLYKVTRQLNQKPDMKEWQKIAADYGMDSDKPKGFDRLLAGIRNVGVGRSILNYSELTAMNVSLTGLQLEYNDRLYAAAAIGQIDFGFRDFFGRNNRQRGQQLAMMRIGKGDIDRSAVIFSVFTGRRYPYGGFGSDSVNSRIQLVGYSIEGILRKDERTGITAEIAKSTGPASGSPGKNGEMNRLVQFSDASNLAVSVKGETFFPKTSTAIGGFIRKTGERYQSFSLFTYNTDQLAWLLKLEQPFWKRRISLTTLLRRNDFTNPFTEKTFRTTAVFKSVLLNVRVPRYPSLSVGYFPGTQLYLIDKERIRENVYYILNGTLMHHYKVGGLQMLSSAIYNRFNSKGTDTGFIAYRGTNYQLSHSFMWPALQLQGIYSYTGQAEMNFYTLESQADIRLGKWFSLGGGLRYNRVISGELYWGGRLMAMISAGRLGGLQVQYEKSHLPTIHKTLYGIETGRVSWFKNF